MLINCDQVLNGELNMRTWKFLQKQWESMEICMEPHCSSSEVSPAPSPALCNLEATLNAAREVGRAKLGIGIQLGRNDHG